MYVCVCVKTDECVVWGGATCGVSRVGWMGVGGVGSPRWRLVARGVELRPMFGRCNLFAVFQHRPQSQPKGENDPRSVALSALGAAHQDRGRLYRASYALSCLLLPPSSLMPSALHRVSSMQSELSSRGTKRVLKISKDRSPSSLPPRGAKRRSRPENEPVQTRQSSPPPELCPSEPPAQRPRQSVEPLTVAKTSRSDPPPAPTAKRSDSPLAAATTNPCTSLPILLSGSGIAAGLPGCAATRAPSTLRSWPAARIVHDVNSRTKLKAIWLAAKLRSGQAPPAECAAVVRMLTRDLVQMRTAQAPPPPEPEARLPACLAAGLGVRGRSPCAMASQQRSVLVA